MLKMRMGIGILLGVVSMGLAQNAWEVSSPQGNLTMTVNLADRGGTADYSAGVRLYYSLRCRVGDKPVVVLNDSPLGMVRDDQAFVEGLAFVSASKIQKVEQSYTLPHGKKSQYSNTCNEQTIVFQNGRSAKMELIVRVFDNGAAFRYRFPETDAAVHKLTQEATGYAIPKDARCWMMPYDAPTQYSPAYEVYYENDIAVGTPCPKEFGWAFPALFSVEGGKCWALLAEADMDRNYFGAAGIQGPQGRVSHPDARGRRGIGHRFGSAVIGFAVADAVACGDRRDAFDGGRVHAGDGSGPADGGEGYSLGQARPGVVELVERPGQPAELHLPEEVRRSGRGDGLGIHAGGRQLDDHGKRARSTI